MIKAASTRNSGGTIAALKGALGVDTQALDNSSGRIQASGDVQIASGNMLNRAGTISGKNLTITAADFDNSAAGKVIAGGDLSARTLALNNDTGLIQAVGNVQLATSGNQLINTASGNSRGIIAGGTLTVAAGDINNQTGFIASNGVQSITTARDIDNRAGQILAAGKSSIAARNVNNNAGRLNAIGDLSVQAAGRIDNVAGQLVSNGTVAVSATTLTNGLQNGVAGSIEARDIALNAGAIQNTGGTIRADNDARIAATALDNTAGAITARNDLTINAGNLTNTNGTLVGGQNATLTIGSGTLGGTVSANNVTLNVQSAGNAAVAGDVDNLGVISARQNLTINARNLSNKGTLVAGNTLTANAAGNLTNSGEINASNTRLNVGATLTNTSTGLIDGVSTTINAGTTNNTGRIYGDFLSISGNAINNSGTGVIAARDTLLMGAQSITNTDGALIYSLGDIGIAGQVNAGGTLQGAAQNVINASSRIEAARNLSIDAANIVNRNDRLITTVVSSAPVQQTQVQPKDDPTRYPSLQCIGIGGGQDNNFCIIHPKVYGLRTALPQARTSSYVDDGNGGFAYTTQINYAYDSPVFNQFGVTPVGAPPAEPVGGCTSYDSNGTPMLTNTPSCTSWNTAQTAWDRSYQTALDQLDSKLTPFNASVNEDNRVTQFEDYTLFQVAATNSRTAVVTSAPAQMLSGGSMRLAGATTNQDSQVVAGGALSIVGPTVQNLATQGQNRTDYTGTVEFTHVDSCGSFGGSYCRRWDGAYPYNPAPDLTYFDLPTTQLVANAGNLTTRRDLTSTLLQPVTALAGKASPVVVATGAILPAVASTVLPGAVSAQSSQIVSVAAQKIPGNNVVIVSTPVVLNLPTNSLFVIHAEPGYRYLVETDPRFTDRRTFLNSDYFLQALNRDPEQQQKRYGDGFYEQKLVGDQILSLTGKRYLTGYANTETEYQALMNSGVAFARQYQLTPGVALSAEQMASLTTDIVWLTTQTVTLPNGQTQQVLVPQVYLRRPKDGDLQATGTLMAGSDVMIQTQGDLVNSGTIAGSRSTLLAAGNDLLNQGGRISGQQIIARASNDLKNFSGVIQGNGVDSTVTLLAGRDISIQTRTIDIANKEGNSTRTGLDRIATVQGGTVHLDAARDVLAKGATIDAQSDLVVSAGRDITIASAKQRYQIDVKDRGGRSTQGRTGYVHEERVTQATGKLKAGNSVAIVAGNKLAVQGANINAGADAILQGANVSIESAKNSASNDLQTVGKSSYNRVARSDEALVGGNVTAGNNLTINATGSQDGRGDIIVNGAYLSSQAGQVTLAAKNDVRIGTLVTNQEAINESYNKSSNLVSSTTTTISNRSATQQAQGSTITGKSVLIQAGSPKDRTGDITITASSIVADNAVQLDAGRDLTITTAQSTQTTSSSFKQKTSGMFASGPSITIGSKEQKDRSTSTAVINTGSNIASLNGDVALNAGNQLSQTGSQVIAPQGNIDITARRVDINAATNTGIDTEQHEFKQSGLTLAVSSPLITAVQTGQQMSQAASQTKDGRMQAMAAITAGLAAKSAIDALDAIGDPNKSSGVGVSVSIGSSQSKSESTRSSTTAVGSTIAAGNDVTIRATATDPANKADSTINVIGSTITAGNNARLIADGDITLQAADGTAEQHSSNRSSSASIGVGVMLGGAQSGFTVSANASAARGNADGSDVTRTNSQVTAGNLVAFQSGGDTTLKGAVVSGKQVTATVGGNLAIESLQDTSVFNAKQQSAGVGISVPIGAGAISGNVSASKSKIDSNFASVAEQSGLKAGDAGFNVNVVGNTTLTGGAITSTQQAIDKGTNRFVTGGALTTSNIQNQATYSANSVGINLGTGSDPNGKLTPGGTSVGIGRDGASVSSVTASAISGIAANTAARTGDADSRLQKIFDTDKVQKEISAQVSITQSFGREAGKVVSDYAQAQKKSFQEQLKNANSQIEKHAIQAQINDVNMQERVMNVLVGVVTGFGSSAVTKESLSAAADQMRQLMVEDSKKFAGVTDGETTLTNISGPSNGVRGDGFKIAGTRLDLDFLCGIANERCERNSDLSLKLDSSGKVTFAAGSLTEFLKTSDGLRMVGPTGGIQGAKGTLFGHPYENGSWQDKLLEAFSGTHDMLGGKVSGLYDEQGNIKRGMAISERKTYDNVVTTTAILPSTPFAAAELLSPDLWKLISILLRNAK